MINYRVIKSLNMICALAIILLSTRVYAAFDELQCPSVAPEVPAGETQFKKPSIQLKGVMHSIGSEAYLRIPDEFTTRMRENPNQSTSQMGNEILANKNVSSLLDESPNRVTYIIHSKHHENIMITKWRFIKDGARICSTDSEINARVDGWPATIALVESPVAESSRACVWKVDVIYKKRTQYEFWIKDICTEGKPASSKNEIIKEIKNLRQLRF
ncbi:hypothetical protein DFQ15_107118 [Xylophilus ampelinus]|uniref:CNP1-like family protein n=1 Tax=Xylophilus ampelinus TaxID=54067 RepID=A0A318SJ96_9BURK|nr:hypothetical protein DFQ15_107118 [Xylophilus ampelinus]